MLCPILGARRPGWLEAAEGSPGLLTTSSGYQLALALVEPVGSIWKASFGTELCSAPPGAWPALPRPPPRGSSKKPVNIVALKEVQLLLAGVGRGGTL